MSSTTQTIKQIARVSRLEESGIAECTDLFPLGRRRPVFAAALLHYREILLNYFRARKAVSGGVIEGLNKNVKVTFGKSYGFRTDKAREIALFHVLDKLPEPEIIHGFF